ADVIGLCGVLSDFQLWHFKTGFFGINGPSCPLHTIEKILVGKYSPNQKRPVDYVMSCFRSTQLLVWMVCLHWSCASLIDTVVFQVKMNQKKRKSLDKTSSDGDVYRKWDRLCHQSLIATENSVPLLYSTILGCRTVDSSDGKRMMFFYMNLPEIEFKNFSSLKCISLTSDATVLSWKAGLLRHFKLKKEQVEITIRDQQSTVQTLNFQGNVVSKKISKFMFWVGWDAEHRESVATALLDWLHHNLAVNKSVIRLYVEYQKSYSLYVNIRIVFDVTSISASNSINAAEYLKELNQWVEQYTSDVQVTEFAVTENTKYEDSELLFPKCLEENTLRAYSALHETSDQSSAEPEASPLKNVNKFDFDSENGSSNVYFRLDGTIVVWILYILFHR
ncbi:hypothetical protein FGIG_03247, partial [Fasciola gigantica]